MQMTHEPETKVVGKGPILILVFEEKLLCVSEAVVIHPAAVENLLTNAGLLPSAERGGRDRRKRQRDFDEARLLLN